MGEYPQMIIHIHFSLVPLFINIHFHLFMDDGYQWTGWKSPLIFWFPTWGWREKNHSDHGQVPGPQLQADLFIPW